MRNWLFILPFIISSSASAETCFIDGKDAVQIAVNVGFQFNMERIHGSNGSCLWDWPDSPTLIVNAPVNEDIKCKATFFDSRILDDKWELRNIGFSGNNQFHYIQEPIKNDPLTILDISVKKGNSKILVLNHIKLDGMDCEHKWKDAFTNSRNKN